MKELILAANWKMHKTNQETREYLRKFKAMQEEFNSTEVVFCPPFTSLRTADEELYSTFFKLGAQNMVWESEGAYTGEISPLMLKDLGVRYVIIGHSERRWILGETHEQINKKLQAVFEYNLIPIYCVGETEEVRQAGETESMILKQIEEGFQGIDFSGVKNIVIAYEPVWAIGTGLTASGEDARHASACIKEKMDNYINGDVTRLKILYGGSVKKENIGEFVSEAGIHGALVGGASLQVDSFVGIIRAAQEALRK